MTLTSWPLPELDPRDPGPAVRHVDPLVSFPLSPCSHLPLTLLVVLASILALIYHFPLFHPLLWLLVLPACLLIIPRRVHIPACPSLILIYVTGQSWVHTILAGTKQALEAACIHERHFSSPLTHVFSRLFDVSAFLLFCGQLSPYEPFLLSLFSAYFKLWII